MSGFTCYKSLSHVHVHINYGLYWKYCNGLRVRGTNAHPHTLFNKTVMCEKLMVGPDKPVNPEQRLFQACQFSPAGNIQNLSGTPPPLYTCTKAAPTKRSSYKSMKA